MALDCVEGLVEGLRSFVTGTGDSAATMPDLPCLEPPKWYYLIRQSLGVALLKAGQPAEAEVVYREDLKRFPEDGWSLFGLAAALRAQEKSAEAAAVEQRFSKAWSAADVKLTASRF
jgi:predicted Zn-dependent protease